MHTPLHVHEVIISYIPDTLIVRELGIVAIEIKVVSSGVTVTSHSYVPASVTFKGLNVRVMSYGGELIGGLAMVILPFSSPAISAVPFLFQIPRTVTGVSTTSPRVMLQVKMRSRPWKKLVFRGDPEMMGGGGITACSKTKFIT
jgi:hypothetical protein